MYRLIYSSFLALCYGKKVQIEESRLVRSKCRDDALQLSSQVSVTKRTVKKEMSEK